MKIARLVAAILLALPLTVFGANFFLEFFDVKQSAASEGLDLLDAMRKGGLMAPIALGHIVVGALLAIPRLRFSGALLQLPISFGILAFHVTMMPEGNVIAIVMLVLNLVVLAEPKRLGALLAAG